MNMETEMLGKTKIHIDLSRHGKRNRQIRVGKRLRFEVVLTAIGGDIKHVRQLQLDFSRSWGFEVLDVEWRMESLNNKNELDLYYSDGHGERYPHVWRTNYCNAQPVEDEILNLVEGVKTRVAIVRGRVLSLDCGLSVLGPQPPVTSDEGVSFFRGFRKDQEFYTMPKGNVGGGVVCVLPDADEE